LVTGPTSAKPAQRRAECENDASRTRCLGSSDRTGRATVSRKSSFALVPVDEGQRRVDLGLLGIDLGHPLRTISWCEIAVALLHRFQRHNFVSFPERFLSHTGMVPVLTAVVDCAMDSESGRSRIRIPQEHELRSRLSGLGVLLTARKWERAAIVYAFTEVGEVGRGRWYKPMPPKMHIRDFAAKGYAGLTTNKSVSRYRDAWVTAINNGWAVPVEPGMAVILPEQPFPVWPYGPIRFPVARSPWRSATMPW
jgi:hypothetical protein